MKIRRGYADTEVGQIHYREAGTGRPLLLLHQTPSSSAMYVRAMPSFAEHYRVIAPDTPGFGLSDPPPGPPADMSHYGRAVVGLLDQLGVGQASLVGFHTGASIALEVATSYPERVDRVVLSGLLALGSDAERIEWGKRLLRWEPDGRGDFLATYPLPYLRDYFVTSGDPDQYLSELISFLQAGPNYWWSSQAVFRFDARGRLARLAVPALFLGVTGDLLYEATRESRRLAAGSAYAELPGTDGVMLEDPGRFVAAVLEFLAG